jgi:hypothetical protein
MWIREKPNGKEALNEETPYFLTSHLSSCLGYSKNIFGSMENVGCPMKLEFKNSLTYWAAGDGMGMAFCMLILKFETNSIVGSVAFFMVMKLSTKLFTA